MSIRILASIVVLSVVATGGRATDWPQFRGPGGTGVVTGKVLPPDTWTATKNVAWKYEVPGHGWSCPIAVGGKVYVTSCVTDAKVGAPKTGYYAPTDTKTHDGEHRWTLFCLDAATGKVLWERVAHRGKPQHPIHVKASYASETPVSDGERVYAYFGNVGLYCYDTAGKQLWSRSWDVVPTQLNWGTGASPALHKDRLYIVNDNEKQSFIVALDTLTGKDVWKVDRAEKSNWATPFVWESGGRTEIVTCGKGKVRSYDLDGKVLWELGGMSSICVPSPVVAGDLLVISSGYEFGRPRPVFAVKPGASGDITLKKDQTSNEFIAWYKEPAGAYHPTPLVLGDHLYVLYSTGFISCFEAKTGKPVYERERLGGSFTASSWAYDGKVFCLGEDGTTYVVKAGTEFELLGKNVLGEVALATPAIADGRLFVRTAAALYCVSKPTEPEPKQPKKEGAEQAPDLFLQAARKLLKWDEPAEPAKLVGPIYFVGTKGLGCYLIKGSEGHVVLNTGMPGSGPMIEKSITKLGFKPQDVKLVLAGHAHIDHVGGHAHLKRVTGAKIAMMREEVELFESGGKLDFHYGASKAFEFDPAKVDTVFRDEDEIKLGDISITALLTPGHTKGSTTYVLKVVEDGKTYTVVFPDGTSVNPGYRIARNPSYMGIEDDFRRTFRTLEGLKPDIWLTAHNDVHDLDAKLARVAKEGVKAWVDPDGYRKWVATKKEAFETGAAKERAAPAPGGKPTPR